MRTGEALTVSRLIVTGFRLAAGDLRPRRRHTLLARAPSPEYRTPSTEPRVPSPEYRVPSYHLLSIPGLNGNAAQSLASGQTRHFGLRATHTVAPKSISAWLKSKTWRIGRTALEPAQRRGRPAGGFGSSMP